MNSEKSSARKSISYEYKKIEISLEQGAFLIEGYRNFGWEPIHENYNLQPEIGNIEIILMRNRYIMNKMELNRLQQKFEACVNEMRDLELSKTSAASTWALVIGTLGLICNLLVVWEAMSSTPSILLCIILTIPALLCMICPIRIYKKIVAEQTKKIEPFIKEKQEEIREICEKGKRILHLDTINIP